MQLRTIQKFRLPYRYNIRGLWGITKYVTSKIENYLIEKKKINSCICPNSNRGKKIIVSLTTFPERIDKVVITLKSILNQDTSIDEVYLWLATTQFPEEIIPEKLKMFQKYGVKIRFCEDLRPHKKYYYTMMEHPDDIVITVDDDVIYPEDTISRLLATHAKFPDAVVCNNGRWIKVVDGDYGPYNEWEYFSTNRELQPSYILLPIGMGGVLYPPNSLNKDMVFNKKEIQSIVLNTDDLWLKYMAVLNGTRAVITSNYSREFVDVCTDTKANTLSNGNVSGGKNDQVLIELDRRFPEVKQVICGDRS